MITKIGSARDYFEEETRRATFKTWIFNSKAPCSAEKVIFPLSTYNTWIFNSKEPCNAEKMAEAGFIYTGSSREPDSAQCFYCKKSLDGWESTDDPWKEHLKHGLNCDFAKMQKSQSNWTLNDWHELKYNYEALLIREKYEAIKNIRKKQFDNMRMIFK